MRKTAFLLFFILLLSLAAQATAEVYLDREPPADWAEKPVLHTDMISVVFRICKSSGSPCRISAASCLKYSIA